MKISQNPPIFPRILTFSRENPAKLANFSVNLPLKIPRNIRSPGYVKEKLDDGHFQGSHVSCKRNGTLYDNKPFFFVWWYLKHKGYWGHANILITNISNGRHENVKKHTWLIESKLFEGVPNILSGMISKSNVQNTRDAKNLMKCVYIICPAGRVSSGCNFILF